MDRIPSTVPTGTKGSETNAPASANPQCLRLRAKILPISAITPRIMPTIPNPPMKLPTLPISGDTPPIAILPTSWLRNDAHRTIVTPVPIP